MQIFISRVFRTNTLTALRFVPGDQLSRCISSLDDLESGDVVLMCEVMEEATYVRHHKKKIAFILSAMRHFAEGLKEDGVNVDYIRLDDPENTGSFAGELKRAVARHGPDRVIVTHPGEWRVFEDMKKWEADLGIPVEIRVDSRFFATPKDFRQFAKGRKELRMEWFYRDMRRKTGLLMDGDKPAGGAWNFDKENRKSLPENVKLPDPPVFESDETTREVIRLVDSRFDGHMGEAQGMNFPVTRDEALTALDHFIETCLPSFGDYQDAMKEGAPFLFHSLLSAPLNAGLLCPEEICRKAEDAWRGGRAPINAVEGFIRQILGWREYVRGIYWLKMPDYRKGNFFGAKRDLPWFYWSGETDMACMAAAICETWENAYAHHIQRLMVTGNFALLAGIDPAQVEEWYLAVYADAYEWVELPNTHGMALFADGGLMASKPYAASGNYIDRMSDYCADCRYSAKSKDPESLCPFNALYWDFMARNRDKLEGNPRLGMVYRTFDRMDEARVDMLRKRAREFLDALE
ncbi:cryptochrome/photolyase family protein [Rhizobiales bacterium]|uniref:cryptochrome/photolyase family protein n=1 Tax=Hongsoonwoonella zoysiae TaxID=2821844 RepID=UPI00155FE703|nr:cryptochrome/photolyase family protein [Hongsoonwoonella zoysiae]NRG18126.1 cryptochrome/photolyase family protein [Hongsoonwoonella zoysiae]